MIVWGLCLNYLAAMQAMHESNHGTAFLRRPIVYQMRHAVRTTRLDIFLVWFHGDLMHMVSAWFGVSSLRTCIYRQVSAVYLSSRFSSCHEIARLDTMAESLRGTLWYRQAGHNTACSQLATTVDPRPQLHLDCYSCSGCIAWPYCLCMKGHFVRCLRSDGYPD